MKIHEYRAKDLFQREGIPVPEGIVVRTPEEAKQRAKELGGGPVVVKAQVLVGGRGKAGGVKLAQDADQARERAEEILGMKIKGLTVVRALITKAVDIEKEYYLGIVQDRAGQRRCCLLYPRQRPRGHRVRRLLLAQHRAEHLSLRHQLQPAAAIPQADDTSRLR